MDKTAREHNKYDNKEGAKGGRGKVTTLWGLSKTTLAYVSSLKWMCVSASVCVWEVHALNFEQQRKPTANWQEHNTGNVIFDLV